RASEVGFSPLRALRGPVEVAPALGPRHGRVKPLAVGSAVRDDPSPLDRAPLGPVAGRRTAECCVAGRQVRGPDGLRLHGATDARGERHPDRAVRTYALHGPHLAIADLGPPDVLRDSDR